MKRPAFQFYPADWRKDPALSACSLAARGLWIEIICIAHETDVYGHLSINSKPMQANQIARLVGESPAVVTKLLVELEEADVFSRTPEGSIFSRRMVADEHLRNIRAASGRLGGNPELLAKKVNQKDKQKVNQNDKQILTPSSSSSSSSSTSVNSVTDVTDGKPSKLTDPDEIIFGYGVPLLTNAGTADKQARSFLGGLRKQHGDSALIDKLRECAKAKPLQPLEWLAAALPPVGHAPKLNAQEQLEAANAAVAERFLRDRHVAQR